MIWIIKVWLAMWLFDFIVTAARVVKELRAPSESTSFYRSHGGQP